MSQTEKSFFFNALKAAGIEFDRHYREYNTEELRAACSRLVDADPALAIKVGLIDAPPPDALTDAPPADEPTGDTLTDEPPKPALQQDFEGGPIDPAAAAFFGLNVTAPVAPRDPAEHAGQRLNSNPEMQPIRTDPETGRIWFQEEIKKPAFPQPRARRVLTYMDAGTTTKTVQNGDYLESFEVAGDPANARPAEVKVTMPSYQVGIYLDPRFPFRVHTYNSLEGFDLFEVQNFYGGPELVPAEIKRIYVENVLCYDIRTTVRAIETEYRQQQLAGRIQ